MNIMNIASSRSRFKLVLIGVLVAALAAVTIAVHDGGPAAATECGDGASGSATCFTMLSGAGTDVRGHAFGNLGVVSTTADSNQLSVGEVDRGTAWQLQPSSDHKTFGVKNLNSTLCLKASVLNTSNYPGTLTSCPGPSRFKFVPVAALANTARFVSVDTPGYCLDVLTQDRPVPISAVAGTAWLTPCGDAASQQWHFSGPTAGAGAEWPKSIAMQAAFLSCADTSWTCKFQADNNATKPQLKTKSVCLAIPGGNPMRNSTSVAAGLSVAYSATTSTTQTLGASFDQSVGFEALLGGWGLSTSIGWGYSTSESFTHAETDTSSYSVMIPAGQWGWLGSKEFTAVTSGTWSFDIGTSYGWSDHESNFSFPDLSADHHYGHVVTAGVGATRSSTCQ